MTGGGPSHAGVSMASEGRHIKGFGEQIGVIISRGHVLHANLAKRDPLANLQVPALYVP